MYLCHVIDEFQLHQLAALRQVRAMTWTDIVRIHVTLLSVDNVKQKCCRLK